MERNVTLIICMEPCLSCGSLKKYLQTLMKPINLGLLAGADYFQGYFLQHLSARHAIISDLKVGSVTVQRLGGGMRYTS